MKGQMLLDLSSAFHMLIGIVFSPSKSFWYIRLGKRLVHNLNNRSLAIAVDTLSFPKTDEHAKYNNKKKVIIIMRLVFINISENDVEGNVDIRGIKIKLEISYVCWGWVG